MCVVRRMAEKECEDKQGGESVDVLSESEEEDVSGDDSEYTSTSGDSQDDDDDVDEEEDDSEEESGSGMLQDISIIYLYSWYTNRKKNREKKIEIHIRQRLT